MSTEPAESVPFEPLIDWDAARAGMPGDESLVRQLATVFQAEAPELISRMRTAANQGLGDDLRRAAHTLKGSATIFAVQQLVDAAEEIEEIAKSGQIDNARPRLDALETAVTRVTDELHQFLNQPPQA